MYCEVIVCNRPLSNVLTLSVCTFISNDGGLNVYV